MNKTTEQISRLIRKLEELIPLAMKREEDKAISNGNAAVCIIDESGEIFGKLFVNNNKIRARESFRIAWIKASQVWLTGVKTGEYEKKVYSGEISEGIAGISKPDFIGWEGGQPVILKDGSQLSVGFSGFRGVTDLEIVLKAVEQIEAAVRCL
jgi:glc operon protein GlcG